MIIMLAIPVWCHADIVWYEPADATPFDAVTIYYDASQGNGDLRDFKGDVYAHCGAITAESSSNSDWKHASGWCDNDTKYRLSRSENNANLYTLTITPMDFFPLVEGERLCGIAFVMRNADGSVCGRSSDGSDIIMPFANGSTSPDYKDLGRMTSWQSDGRIVTITGENGQLILTAYGQGVIKVFTVFNGTAAVNERRSITVNVQPGGAFSVSEGDEDLRISDGTVILSVKKEDCRITFYDEEGREMLRERGGLNNSTFPRTVTFEGMGDRAFYGGGYNGKRIDHNHTTLVMDNRQTGGWDATWDAPHNICIPFIVSSEGYGLLFDDHYRGARLSPSSDGTSYTSGSKAPISYYYIGSADGSMASVLENYTYLTGRQELPPYWALGYMTSRYGYRTRQEAENAVAEIKKIGLPLDAIVFDLYWQGPDNSGMGNLDWYASGFPDASGMMKKFRQEGVNTICITEPFFTSVASGNYTTLKDLGYFADEDVSRMEWLGADKVGLIDASNPAAMDWMWNFYSQRTREGVGGWWLDLGEPESHDTDSYHQGGTSDEVHNEFGNLWLERVYRGLKEEFPETRPFLMPRAGTSGMQRFSAFPWSGDIRRSWLGLQAQIPALISSGMSGVAYMGSDVSGFANDNHTDAWLYRRWVQMAVFSPMMRTHSTYLPEPYHDCYKDVLEDVREAINMRYSYLPYTYSLTWENAVKGTPLARPINFHDRSASSPADVSDEYLWGKDILVAPVVKFLEGISGDYNRVIVFPEGEWVDLNDMDKVYQGGTTVTYDTPHSILPHFGRKGSFITRFTQTEFRNTDDVDNSRLTVIYLMDGDVSGVTNTILFDDDHKSPSSLAEGQVLYTEFSGRNNGAMHEIKVCHSGSYRGMPGSRVITFVIPGITYEVGSVSDSMNNSFQEINDAKGGDSAGTFRKEGNTLTVTAAIPTTGEYTIKFPSDPNSDVAEIEHDRNVVETARYDVMGRRLSSSAHGVNIIVYSDGSVRKEIIAGSPVNR